MLIEMVALEDIVQIEKEELGGVAIEQAAVQKGLLEILGELIPE